MAKFDYNSIGIRGEIGRVIEGFTAQAQVARAAADATTQADVAQFQRGKALGLELAIAELAALRVRL